MPLMGQFSQLSFEAANAQMIGEFFGRIDTAAALPGLRALVESWRPDVIVRESWEYAAAPGGRAHGIPHRARRARSRGGRGADDRLGRGRRRRLARRARPARRSRRRPPPRSALPHDDPCAARGPGGRGAARDPSLPRRRVRGAGPSCRADWWPGQRRSAGLRRRSARSTAAPHLPYFPALYRTADRRARAAAGAAADHRSATLATSPARPAAAPTCMSSAGSRRTTCCRTRAAIVCHGGHGSTLGALAHGIPLVVVPLFSLDQVANGDRRRARRRRRHAGRRHRRPRALDLPAAATLEGLGPAVGALLADDGPGARRRGSPAAMRALPPADGAVDVLAALARD